MGDLVLDLTPTQSAFVNSEAHIVQLHGPFGEGKTYAGAVALPVHAIRCGCNIRGALIRDTHTNLKTSTVPDLKGYFGEYVTFHDDDRKMVLHTSPSVEMDLFGIDDPASLSKLQGPQYSIVWLEEPAPIEARANAGLPMSVFEMALARAARQSGTKMRVQLTHNPADEDHWVEYLAAAPRIYFADPDSGFQLIKETFYIPHGENKHLNAHARAAAKAAFASDPGKYSRYVLGIPAATNSGKPVATAYNGVIHYSKKELEVVPNALGLRGWDSWTHPVCVIGQLLAPDWLRIHHVCIGDGIGPKELVQRQVIPMMLNPKYCEKIKEWRDIGDPTMLNPDQSTVSQTAAQLVTDMLRGYPRGFTPRFEPGPASTHGRVRPLNTALSMLRANGSGPQIEISATASLVHRCLSGGWHWKTDNSGGIIGVKPVKDKYGDIGDALAYMVARVFPYERNDKVDLRQDRLKMRIDQMNMAAGYGPSKAQQGPLIDPAAYAVGARYGAF